MPADGQAKPKHYKELLVWQKGMVLARLVYKVTMKLPAEERYGLTSQMRRAAVSVPSNIAEGQARRGTSEFLQFLSIAEGSLAELDTQFRERTFRNREKLQELARPSPCLPFSNVGWHRNRSSPHLRG